VDVTGIEPVTPCLQKQTAKLDGEKLDEKDEDGEKDPTKSGDSE
jgi:hypothetical protein